VPAVPDLGSGSSAASSRTPPALLQRGHSDQKVAAWRHCVWRSSARCRCCIPARARLQLAPRRSRAAGNDRPLP
jgi:hypothetical protein